MTRKHLKQVASPVTLPALRKVLKIVYPDFPWEAGKFVDKGIIPRNHWRRRSNVLQEITRVANAIEIKQVTLDVENSRLTWWKKKLKPQDWYSVALADLREIGFPLAITKVQLSEMLVEMYPDFDWDVARLLRGKGAQQKRLENAIRKLFAVCTILLINLWLKIQKCRKTRLRWMYERRRGWNARQRMIILSWTFSFHP